MNKEIQKQLKLLKSDYEKVSNRTWRHFFCPILHQDEKTELCRGHVINQSFKDSDRSWVVQRSDVDSFFGTLFESEFSLLEELDHLNVDEILENSTKSKHFKPFFTADDQPIDYYRSKDKTPNHFSKVTYNTTTNASMSLTLKVTPTEMEELLDKSWKVTVDKDIRLPALVSLLKAAHLTLFQMLGYQYALSAGGRFLGKTILGDLFLKTRDMKRVDALKEAKAQFKQYQNLVRPVDELNFDSKGTLTDNLLFVCVTGTEKQFWAFNVIVRTGKQFHGVLVPILDHHESAARFHCFLESPSPLIVKLTRLKEDGGWEGQIGTSTLEWPPVGLDSPTPSQIT